MNRSVRFVTSVFLVAFSICGIGWQLVGTAHASTHLETALARQDLGDFDGDGLPNYQDVDDDNDGVLDEEDADPFNSDIWETSQLPTSVPEPTTPPTSEPTTAPTPAAELPTEVPVPPTPQESAPDPSEAPDPVAPVPVVSTLPDTGSGGRFQTPEIAYSAACAMVVLFGAGSLLRKTRW